MRNVVKVRLVMKPEGAEELVDMLAETLEKRGFEMIERSRVYPCREPDQDKVRYYLTAIRTENDENN